MSELVAPEPCLSPVFPHLPLLFMAVLAREGSLHSPHNGTAADSSVVASAAARCRRPCRRLGPYNTTRFPPSSVIPPVLGDMYYEHRVPGIVENGVVEDGSSDTDVELAAESAVTHADQSFFHRSARVHGSHERIALDVSN